MQELLEVRLGDPGAGPVDDEKALRALIPFVRALVPEVDLARGEIHVVPPPGLLGLARPPPRRKVSIRGLLPLWGLSGFWLLPAAAGVDKALARVVVG